MLNFLSITKSLADENRLRILMALNGRELCVCQITEILGLAPSTVSKHMQILTQARLVEIRKDGRWRYYSLAGDDAPEQARNAIAWVFSSVSNAPRIRQDSETLNNLLKISPGELCRMKSKAL